MVHCTYSILEVMKSPQLCGPDLDRHVRTRPCYMFSIDLFQRELEPATYTKLIITLHARPLGSEYPEGTWSLL